MPTSLSRLRTRNLDEPTARFNRFLCDREKPQLDQRPLPKGLPPRGTDGMWGTSEIGAATARAPRSIAKLLQRRRDAIRAAWDALSEAEQDALLAAPEAQRLAWKDSHVGPRDIPEPTWYDRRREARFDPLMIIPWLQRTGRLSLDYQPLELHVGGRPKGFTNPGAARLYRGWPRDERGQRRRLSDAERAAWRKLTRAQQDAWLAQPDADKLAWIARVNAEASQQTAA
jgi:hypothetical protein